jgi:hypothetical protein
LNQSFFSSVVEALFVTSDNDWFPGKNGKIVLQPIQVMQKNCATKKWKNVFRQKFEATHLGAVSSIGIFA